MNNRKFNYAAQQPLYSTGRQPSTAAMLSVIPGLGQFYNGQSVKGFLFLDVAAVNAILLTVVLFAEPMAKGIKTMLSGNHIRANDGVLQALASAHLGTPFSMVLLSMILLFVGFAVRDAYDSARVLRRKPIYGDSALQLSEAASGSYLFHFAALFSLAILALCFLVPKPATQQLIEIEFRPTPVKDVEPVQAHKRSDESSSAKHRDVQVKNPTPPSSTASASRQSAQQHNQTHAQSRPTPPTPTQARPTAKQPVEQKSTPAKSEPAPAPPLFHPTAAPAPKQPSPVQHATPMPMPLSSNKAPAPNPVANNTPIPSALKATNNAPTPTPLLAMAPKLTAGPGPTPMALSHASGSSTSNLPSPAEARRGSSSTSNVMPGGAPQIQNAAFNGNNPSQGQTPAPISGAHSKGNNDSPSSSGDAIAPKKIASVLPPGGGVFSPVTGGGPKVGSTPSLRESRGTDTESGVGKSHENVKKDVNFGPYMAELQRRIKRAWTPPRDPNSRQVVLEFKIFKSGELGSVKCVRSSGLSKNDEAAISAVRAAAPFAPLPDGADDSVDIQFTFDYHVFGGHASY
ncbi:MAG TPA: TonB family protein [Drouetiella sp.]